MKPLLRALVLLPLALGACGGRSCGSSRATLPAASAVPAALVAPAASAPPRLRVPHAVGPIKADGELDEETWRDAARTESFLDQQTGELSRPYSDTRLLWDEKNLYLARYAADEDINATARHDEPLWLKDAFSIRISIPGRADAFGIEVAPSGVVTDFLVRPDGTLDRGWESGALVGVDLDGTLNDESDEDEEWIIEAAIPWSSLGITDPIHAPPLGLKLSRCDTPRDHRRRCASWGEGVIEMQPAAR